MTQTIHRIFRFLALAVVIAVAGLSLLPGQSEAQSSSGTLYMLGYDPPGLFTLNTSTGNATKVGTLTNFGVSEDRPSGLAYDTKRNVAYFVGFTTDALYTIDLTTGAVTRIGAETAFGVGETDPSALMYVPTTDTLYLVGNTIGALHTLNISTGRATRVGSATLFGVNENRATGLTYNSSTNTAYFTGRGTDRLYTLNLTTGVATKVSDNRISSNPRGLATDGTTTWSTDWTTDALYSVNTANGRGSRIGTATKFGVNQDRPGSLEYVPKAPPGPVVPTTQNAPTFTNIKNTSATVNWVAPSSSAAITSYSLQYRVVGTSPWTTRTGITGTSLAISNLITGAEYEFQVKAHTASEESAYSPSGKVTTTFNVTAPTFSSTASRSTVATWAVPATVGPVTTYDLRYRVVGTTVWVDRAGLTVATLTVTGLTPKSEYEFQVRAHTATADSEYSASAKVTTTAVAGGPPTLTAKGDTSIVATWELPATPITGVQLRWRVGHEDWTESQVFSNTTTSAEITDLIIDTTYQVEVIFRTASGSDEWSHPANLRTRAVPGAPTNAYWAPTPENRFTPTRFDKNGRSYWWTPATTGGSAERYILDGYSGLQIGGDRRLISNTASDTCIELPFQQQPGAGGREYIYQTVKGQNHAGTGGTATFSQGTFALAPLPTIDSTKLVEGKAVIAWSVGDYPANGPPLAYDLRYKPVAESNWTDVRVTGTSVTLEITVDIRYDLEIRSVSCFSTSNYAATEFTLGDPAPEPVKVNTFTTSATTKNSISVAWDAPTNYGPSISSYDLRYKTGSDSYTTVNNILTTSYEITGLTANTTYDIQVRAVNATGPADWSTPAYRVLTDPDIPSQPDAPVAGVTAARQVIISWTAPADNGSAITNYSVRYRQTGVTQWIEAKFDTSLRREVGSLTPFTEYEFQVKATNGVGDSPWSTSLTLTTSAAKPDAPDAPFVVLAASRNLNLSWTAPADNGSAITGYKLRLRAKGVQAWGDVHELPNTAGNISQLVPATEYEFQVLATNALGDSPWSASGMGRTSNAPPEVPDAPTITSAGPTSIRVTWTAPVDNGDTITSYDLRWRVSGLGVYTEVTGITGTEHVIENLMRGTRYYVEIRATNALGTSAYSSQGSGSSDPVVPSKPEKPTVTPASITSLRASWVAPDDGGASISSYDLRYRESGTASWTPINDVTDTMREITGLTNGLEYEVQVRATNTKGDSDWSDSGLGTTAAPPATPDTIATFPYLTDTPSFVVERNIQGNSQDAGIRWAMAPKPSQELRQQFNAVPNLVAGWHVTLHPTVSTQAISKARDVPANGLDLACGNPRFYDFDIDMDVCESVTPFITLADIRDSRRVDFRAYILRPSDNMRWESSNKASWINVPRSEDESIFTLDVPEIRSAYHGTTLVIAVIPVVGADETQVSVDGSDELHTFSTPTASSTAVQVWTLHVPVETTDTTISFKVRNAAYAGNEARTINTPGGGTYRIPRLSWVYSWYTAEYFVRTNQDNTEIPIPEAVDDKPELPGDARFNSGIQAIIDTIPGDSSNISLFSVKIGVVVLFTLLISSGAAWMFGRGDMRIGMLVGSSIGFLLWGLGAVLAGFGITIWLPVALLAAIIGAWSFKKIAGF